MTPPPSEEGAFCILWGVAREMTIGIRQLRGHSAFSTEALLTPGI